MFINNIYKNDNFYIEKNDHEITKFYSVEASSYITAQKDGKIYIFYEDLLGNIIKLTIENNTLLREFLLISKEKKNQGRTINVHFRGDELVLIFSSIYKGMVLINIYTEKNGICVFDSCDSKSFISVKKKNDEILVVYRKGIKIGYSLILDGSYSDYKAISSKSPISAYEFGNDIFILCREDRYILVDVYNDKKYNLPIIFGIKPEITCTGRRIYLTYLKGRREIVYMIEDNVILFHKERMLA